MRLNYDDPSASKIRKILLNGKPLRMSVVTALDTDEGWVDTIHVILPDSMVVEKNKRKGNEIRSDQLVVDTSSGEIPAPPLEWETKRLHGKVEIIWNDGSKSSSDRLPEEGEGEEEGGGESTA